jgi:hypothetical protein
MPSLELAVRIGRYFEVNTDDLFAWRVADDGARRPLLIELPGTRKLLRLSVKKEAHGSLELVKAISESLKEGKNLLEYDDIWRKP